MVVKCKMGGVFFYIFVGVDCLFFYVVFYICGFGNYFIVILSYYFIVGVFKEYGLLE